MRTIRTIPFLITTTTRKLFMVLTSKVIQKKISAIISRFNFPKIPPNMINQLGVEKEALTTN